MDTKEKRRRAPDRTARAENGGAHRRSSGTRKTPDARGRGAAGRREAQPRRVRTVRREQQPKRVVRAPKEPVPEVRYTMPKPFRKGAFVLKLASVAAVVAALVMCLSLFFRVEEVVVSGADKYTPWMIKEASGISDGDSLLSVSDARVSGKIISALPYVKEVRVGIKLPGTVNIEVTELEMTYAMEARDGTWWLIAANGRVIEQIHPTASSGYTRIFGVKADGPRVEHTVQAVEETPEPDTQPTGTEENDGVTLPVIEQVTGAQRLEAVLTILQSLEDSGVIGQIASVDVSNLNDITMEYGQRLHIVLGTAENLPYKIRYMAQAISQLETYETGELDVSFKFSEQALLNPES